MYPARFTLPADSSLAVFPVRLQPVRTGNTTRVIPLALKPLIVRSTL